MKNGKAAGVRCRQLTEDNRCRIFGSKERPHVCSSLKPDREMCGDCDDEAMERLTGWERITKPD